MLSLSHLTKQQARQILKEKTEQLSPNYFLQAGKSICNTIIQLSSYQQAENLFCFVSTPKEPCTFSLILHALQNHKKVFVPKTFKQGKMMPCQITSLEQLTPQRFGILEPAICNFSISADRLEFSLIPCVSLSLCFERLGHGGGYYDRFLPQLSGTVLGCCAAKLMVKDLPTEKHDIPMPAIITEKALLL